MVMPATVEERDAERNRRGSKETLIWNMHLYCREICFILLLIITAYASLHNA